LAEVHPTSILPARAHYNLILLRIIVTDYDQIIYYFSLMKLFNVVYVMFMLYKLGYVLLSLVRAT